MKGLSLPDNHPWKPWRRVALGKKFRRCASIPCVGVFPNWDDYPRAVREALRAAELIYYPSRLYEDLFLSLGKRVFPRNYYRLMGNKIRQSELFLFHDIPHPRTRVYRGHCFAAEVLGDFSLPVVAKDPIGSSQGEGVWLIQDESQLQAYLERFRPAYIQEYLPVDRDLRVVMVAGKLLHAYWRIAPKGEFRNNVSRGGTICYEHIPGEALEFAGEVARRCHFDDVGLDICFCSGRYYVLEANMVYGLEGFRRLGLDLHRQLEWLDKGGHL